MAVGLHSPGPNLPFQPRKTWAGSSLLVTKSSVRRSFLPLGKLQVKVGNYRHKCRRLGTP